MKISHFRIGTHHLLFVVLVLALALLLLSTAASAQGHAGRAARGAGHAAPAAGHWQGDIGRFHERDWNTWRGGRWVHGSHGSQLGWWWVAGGLWYLYPQVVYPYPNPYEPPQAPVAAPMPPPTPVWYYCEAAQRYYPYVATCPAGWKQVPAVPSNSPLPSN